MSGPDGDVRGCHARVRSGHDPAPTRKRFRRYLLHLPGASCSHHEQHSTHGRDVRHRRRPAARLVTTLSRVGAGVVRPLVYTTLRRASAPRRSSAVARVQASSWPLAASALAAARHRRRSSVKAWRSCAEGYPTSIPGMSSLSSARNTAGIAVWDTIGTLATTIFEIVTLFPTTVRRVMGRKAPR